MTSAERIFKILNQLNRIVTLLFDSIQNRRNYSPFLETNGTAPWNCSRHVRRQIVAISDSRRKQRLQSVAVSVTNCRFENGKNYSIRNFK